MMNQGTSGLVFRAMWWPMPTRLSTGCLHKAPTRVGCRTVCLTKRREWDERSVFLVNGATPIDNNELEAECRRLTTGRRSGLLVGRSKKGQKAATRSSWVSLAARHCLVV